MEPRESWIYELTFRAADLPRGDILAIVAEDMPVPARAELRHLDRAGEVTLRLTYTDPVPGFVALANAPPAQRIRGREAQVTVIVDGVEMTLGDLDEVDP